ncbi:hypothetical protein PR048_015678 [Dryococelus australis]|uniref:Uncharacterized protein n=1 Tax=Dryococelus australis TaxID=614101 RepID=A0ABQ9HIN7_9NEOP|nr:hypothetical protein PR048_015678 [Dryococelus australis]
MKCSVYETPIASLEDHVARIRTVAEIIRTTPGMFDHVRQSWHRRCTLRSQTDHLPSKRIGFDSSARHPSFRMWEMWRTLPLASWFSRGTLVSSGLAFRHCSIFTSLHTHQLLRPRC